MFKRWGELNDNQLARLSALSHLASDDPISVTPATGHFESTLILLCELSKQICGLNVSGEYFFLTL